MRGAGLVGSGRDHYIFPRSAVLGPHTQLRRCSRQALPGLRLPRITASFLNKAAQDSRPCARFGSQQQRQESLAQRAGRTAEASRMHINLMVGLSEQLVLLHTVVSCPCLTVLPAPK